MFSWTYVTYILYNKESFLRIVLVMYVRMVTDLEYAPVERPMSRSGLLKIINNEDVNTYVFLFLHYVLST